MKQSALRSLPAVEKVLQSLGTVDVPRPTVVGVVRRELAGLRSEKQVPDFEAVLARIRFSLDALRRSRILPVINGTGVIVHTNLGRSPLGPAVVETMRSNGHDPCVVLQTSHGNLQAWVQVSVTPIEPAVARKRRPW